MHWLWVPWMMPLHLPLLPTDPTAPFPHPRTALRVPDGLLAAGGDLAPERLLAAYRQGIFPWFSPGQPILWWSPDPRTVFSTDEDGVRLSSRFRRTLRRCSWTVRADTAFGSVIHACAATPRHGQAGTWISASMLDAYVEMHRLGHAHSVEVFEGPRLVGGLYGVAVGRMFFGESMFSACSGGSKVALAALALRLREWGWPLLDAQVGNPHLMSMGAQTWPRAVFLDQVATLADQPSSLPLHWTGVFGEISAASLASTVG